MFERRRHPGLFFFHGSIAWPMRSHVNASPIPSRAPAHDSGPMWIVTPSPQWTLTTDFLPVSRRTREIGLRKKIACREADVPAGAVYIGRGSKWGNPFRIGPDGDRAAVIAKYERWLCDQHDLLRALDELRGRDLVCFCAPLRCHGDLLLRLAKASREDRIRWWRSLRHQD